MIGITLYKRSGTGYTSVSEFIFLVSHVFQCLSSDYHVHAPITVRNALLWLATVQSGAAGHLLLGTHCCHTQMHALHTNAKQMENKLWDEVCMLFCSMTHSLPSQFPQQSSDFILVKASKYLHIVICHDIY